MLQHNTRFNYWTLCSVFNTDEGLVQQRVITPVQANTIHGSVTITFLYCIANAASFSFINTVQSHWVAWEACRALRCLFVMCTV